MKKGRRSKETQGRLKEKGDGIGRGVYAGEVQYPFKIHRFDLDVAPIPSSPLMSCMNSEFLLRFPPHSSPLLSLYCPPSAVITECALFFPHPQTFLSSIYPPPTSPTSYLRNKKAQQYLQASCATQLRQSALLPLPLPLPLPLLSLLSLISLLSSSLPLLSLSLFSPYHE